MQAPSPDATQPALWIDMRAGELRLFRWRYSLEDQAAIATERRNFSPSKSVSVFSMP
jgi:hypothetical protein